MLRRNLAIYMTLLFLAACKIPADPNGTSAKIEGSTLRVGALHALSATDEAALAAIAEEFGAAVEVVDADPHRLFDMLIDGQLHILAGHIPADTPFAAEVALSDPVSELTHDGRATEQVLALLRGENRFLMRVNRAISEVQP